MVRFTKDLVRTWTSALDDTMGGRSAQPRASARGRYTTTRSSQPAQKPSSASFSSNHAQATDGSGRRKPYERHRSCHVGPAAPDQVVPCPRHSRGQGKNRRRETVRGFACHLRSDVESHSLRHVVYSVQIFTLHSGCMVSTIPWNHTPIVIE